MGLGVVLSAGMLALAPPSEKSHIVSAGTAQGVPGEIVRGGDGGNEMTVRAIPHMRARGD